MHVQAQPAVVQMAVDCLGLTAGSICLRSAAARAGARWTEHLSGRICTLQQENLVSSPALSGPTHFKPTRDGTAAKLADILAIPAPSAGQHHQWQRRPTPGVTARLALSVQAGHGAAAGYGAHPAAADAALHTGAVNPAAPADGRTRVPAALDALHILPADTQVRGGGFTVREEGGGLLDASLMS